MVENIDPSMNSNDIIDAQINSSLRPYFQGMTARNSTIATIVLLSDVIPNKAETNESNNYLESFGSYINTSLRPIDNASPGGIDTQVIPKLNKLETTGVTEYYGIFNNFSLMSVNESKEQMTKVHMNFGGSWNAFFFGDKPTVYSFSGFFLDSQEYPYYQEFLVAYENYLSGRKCVENKFQMLISYDGKIIDGYILGINTGISSDNQYIKSFTFSVLVKSENWYRNNIVFDNNGKAISGLNYMSSMRALPTKVLGNKIIASNLSGLPDNRTKY